ncbi:hypothetical protein [Herpetosiphon gulosus]|uniref:Uncharacterized protein n=1 Tax=Herpetosiphon gulosus TaxID=1973496 RepID=A0ABP9WZ96_9CHLR
MIFSHLWPVHLAIAALWCLMLIQHVRPRGAFKILSFSLIALLIVGCIDFLHSIVAYLLPFELLAIIVSSGLNSFMLFCCFGWLFDYDYQMMLASLKRRFKNAQNDH